MKTILIIAILAFVGLIASAQAADPPKPYPLQTCLVSGEKLGSMGKPFVFVYEGQEIKFCCAGCKKKFEADPAKYMKELEAAQKGG